MKRLLALLPILSLALVSFTAKADTLTDNPGNGTIGPYSLTFNPGNTTLSLFCLDDNLHINSGETWTVQVVLGSALSTNSLTMGSATQYEEEAFIVSQLGGIFVDMDVQEALWKIFDTSRDITTDPNAVTLFNEATGAAGATFIADGGYDSFVYYIYDGGTITGRNSDDANSLPQNFLDPTPNATTPTPEPSSLFLLGSALLGLAGVARRKLVRR